ncbi:hypothetical protein D3C80_935820 [compost metagenome]
MNSMDKIRYYIRNSYDYFFAILILFLPFSKSVPNITMALLIAFFVIDFKKGNFRNYTKSSSFILFLLVCYLFGQAILNGSFITDLEFYKKYFYVLIIPILFLKVNDFELLKKAALVTINAAIIVSLFKISVFYFDFGYFPFNEGWATNYVLVLERPYAGIFSILSIILSFDQIQRNPKKRYLFLASCLLSVFFIMFIAIRISILTFFVLFGIYIFFYMKLAFKRKMILFIGLLTTIALGLIFNKNISKRFFINDSIEKTLEKAKQSEPRVIIYGCAKDITDQADFSVFFGTDSYSNIEKSLVDCYKNTIEDYSRRSFFLEKRYNTHSQFIDFYLIGGLIAIIIFLGFFVKSIFEFHSSFFTVAILVSFLMMLTIENIFHRQFGCFIFIIFTGLYLNEKSDYGKI